MLRSPGKKRARSCSVVIALIEVALVVVLVLELTGTIEVFRSVLVPGLA